MKKIIKKLALFLLTLHLVLLTNSVFVLADTAPESSTAGDVMSPIEKLEEIAGKTQLPQYSFSSGSDSPEGAASGSGPHTELIDTGLVNQKGIVEIASPLMYALDLFRFAISGIAIVVIVITSIKLISTSTEEEAAKAKNSLMMGMIGLLVIQMADVAVKKVFFGDTGQCFSDVGELEVCLTGEEGGINFFRGILGFINILLGAIAVLVIVVRGFTLIVSGGDEESMGKAKKHILYAIIGLMVIGLSEFIVRDVIFPVKWDDNIEDLSIGAKLAMVDVEEASNIIIKLTTYLSSFVSILAFLALFFAGYKYVISGGDEEAIQSVKKTAISAVIAIFLALGAFAIVNTLMRDNTETGAYKEVTAQSTYVTWHQELPY